ncbi:MAG: hypothetical protein PHT13_08780 [Methanosarcina sp.]|nr:hypothetical protein [Methanosarcina sp.]
MRKPSEGNLSIRQLDTRGKNHPEGIGIKPWKDGSHRTSQVYHTHVFTVGTTGRACGLGKNGNHQA